MKYRKNRTSSRMMGSAHFEGLKKEPGRSIAVSDLPIASKLPRGFVFVGELVELECETPLEPKVNSFSLIRSSKSPIVMAGGDGKSVLIVSSDAVKDKVDINPDSKIVKQAVDLHAAFHGTDFDKIKKVDISDPEVLVFWGHLNFVVYSVPEYSERRGVPFIHEAKDRGDDEKPADEKPIVLVSPKRDFLVMYGPQFVFTERGMIG